MSVCVHVNECVCLCVWCVFVCGVCVCVQMSESECVCVINSYSCI